jgi:acid stress-induced BolA-like protein IbaG/YrbA
MTEAQKDTLAEALRRQFAADVDVEQVGPNGRFRFAVMSPQFERMEQLRRQDLIWDVVDQTLPREATLDISLILAFAPSELASAGDAPRE